MQIHEITVLKENALAAFTTGFNASAGTNLPTGANTSTTPTGKYGPAGQQQAAQMSQPMIAQLATNELKTWNASVLDLLKKNNVSSPAMLDRGTKNSLAQSLVQQLQRSFMQNKLGNDYKSLPSLVDQTKQADAKNLVNIIQTSLNSILNFDKPAQDEKTQLAKWTALSQAAHDAMSMVQFNSSKAGRVAGRAPELKQTTNGTYTIGGQKLDPNNPDDAKMIQKIKAANVALPGTTV